MANYLLSIGIAAYNMERYVGECLESLDDEYVLKKCQIIVIDDGSKDSTFESAEKFKKKFGDSLVLVKQENRGLGGAQNTAMRLATGRYYKWLDADDYLCKDNLCRLLSELEKINVDCVITPNIMFKDEGCKGEYIGAHENNELFEGEIYTTKDFVTCFENYGMHNLLFSRKVLKNINLFEHCFYVDTQWVINGLLNCKNMAYFNLPVYAYRIGREGQSVSTMGIYKHKDEEEKIIDYFWSMFRSTSNEYEKNVIYHAMMRPICIYFDLIFGFPLSKDSFHRYKKYGTIVSQYYKQSYWNIFGKTVSTNICTYFYRTIRRHMGCIIRSIVNTEVQ